MRISIPFLLVLACLSAVAAADTLTIQSRPGGSLTVECNSDTQELTFSRNGKPFAEHVKPWDGLGDVPTAKKVQLNDPLGQGDGIDIEGAAGTQHIWVVPGSPFVFTRVDVHPSSNAVIIKDITPFTFSMSAAGDNTRLFSPEGITKPGGGDRSTSYFFLAAVAPASRAGIVTGWITQEIGSGLVDSRGAGTSLSIAPRAEYGKHKVESGTTFRSEIAAVGDFDDARLGLEALADADAKENNIHIRPVMSGYCTWYHAHASNEKDLKALADFAKEQHLKDYGFDFIQIDDGWQKSRRDFSDYNHDATRGGATYPAGMKQTAGNINADGFVAGLWLTPFAWDSKVLSDHLDYFAKTPAGEVYAVKWAGDCFDMTNPAAQQYLSDTISRITHEWGYKYLKVDGLWAGTATTILYPNPQYKPDDYGNAVFHDTERGGATNISAYRTGLRTLRKAAGDDVFICGCNVAQNHRTLAGSIGLLDAMRVGPDIKASWDSISTRAAVFATREYFLNGRVWWNDPDCLMLRDPITLDEARAWGSFIAISGQLNVVSEDLAKLPPEKLDIVKRTMPNVPHAARPLELFSQNQPRTWQAHIGDREAAHDIVGLFNWDEHSPARIDVDTKALSLADGNYVGFDYWENQFVDTFSGTKSFDTKPGACHVLSLVKSADRPQLVSTSRHVLQGGPDIEEVTWDAASSTLRGKSKVVAGDPYELRIVAGPYKLSGATLTTGAKPETSDDNGHVRVKFTPTETGEVDWQVQFAPVR
ncbi:MAG TPA: glycoside hydrolase family 36 protein [Phycisphaerae bacterium]|nr:glycoside hydrolase family 36 protein [Phycisphaerae bacterium]